jgi:hypothetical protein
VSLIPFDDELPGFQAAFDMDQVRADLEEALPRLDSIHSCRMSRFRYRKGARATFLYETQTDAGTNWITGTQWPGSKAWKNFKRNEGAGYATRSRLLLEKFPHDSKLPGVARALLGDRAEILAALRQLHGKSARILSLKPVRYRPHIACVVQLVAGGTGISGERCYYLKFYADESGAGVAQSLPGAHGAARCDILRPSLSIPMLNAVLWPEAPGTAVSHSIQQGDGAAAVAAAAASVRAFHETQLNLPVAAATDVVLRDIEKHVGFIHHFLPDERRNLATLSETIPGRFDNSVRMPIHHDMKPEHVLVHGQDCTLIDVEGLALGDPALDIGNMAARMQAMSWLNGIDTATCQSFASQFVTQSLPLEPVRIDAAIALGKVKLATYAISHQIEGWSAIAALEIEAAARVLDARSGNAKRNAA